MQTYDPIPDIDGYGTNAHDAGVHSTDAHSTDVIYNVSTGAVANYLEKYATAFTHDWFIRPIRDYLRLHFAGVDPLTITTEMTNYHPQRFAQKWRSFQTTLELVIYDNKRLRKHLSPLHRLELKFLQRLKKRIIQHHPTGKLTATELTEHTNMLLQYHHYRQDLEHPLIQQVTYLHPQQLERQLQTLFAVEVTIYQREREYVLETDYVTELANDSRQLVDNQNEKNFGKWNGIQVPFCERELPAIVRNPLKMLALYR